jgi:hypothetical protein
MVSSQATLFLCLNLEDNTKKISHFRLWTIGAFPITPPTGM